MRDILYDFAESQTNSVEYRYPSGIWPVYTGDYVLREHSDSRTFYKTGSSKPRLYVETPYFPDDDSAVPVRNPGHEASHHEPSEQRSPTLWLYSPLREPGLFIEFARLFDPRDPRGIDPRDPRGRPITAEEQAAPMVEDWVERHGVLGEYAPYPTTNGERVWQRCNHRQSVLGFVYHAVRAGRCLRLLEAAKAPGGPDVERIREMGMLGVRGDTPARLAESAERQVDAIIDVYLMRETCLRRYRLDDGTSFRAPGFHSLLGAMYLQMSNFRDASIEDITLCKECGELINVEQAEPPPSDAPRGARGKKHKTHKNREFCKEKYGKKDYCKNQFNYKRRKKAREGS